MDMENNTNNKSAEKKETKIDLVTAQLQELMNLVKKQQEDNLKLQEEIKTLKEGQKTVLTSAEAVEPENSYNNEIIDPDRMVEIVHLYENAPGLETTLFTSDDRPLKFRGFGDSFKVRYFEFQSILSRYYELFTTNRIFTLGKHDEDVMRETGLPLMDDFVLTREEEKKLASLSTNELITIYNRVCDTHKQLILSTFQREYFSGKPEYQDINKISALNNASGFKLYTVYDDIKSKMEK